MKQWLFPQDGIWQFLGNERLSQSLLCGEVERLSPCILIPFTQLLTIEPPMLVSVRKFSDVGDQSVWGLQATFIRPLINDPTIAEGIDAKWLVLSFTSKAELNHRSDYWANHAANNWINSLLADHAVPEPRALISAAHTALLAVGEAVSTDQPHAWPQKQQWGLFERT